MHSTVRPWVTSGIAIAGASVIAVAPIMPLPTPPEAPVAVAKVRSMTVPDVQLTATIVDILQFPALRQYIINEVGDFLIQIGGLVGAATGLGQVIASIPETLVLLTQQLFSLNLTGALDTITSALVDGFLTVALPIIESRALIQEREAAIFGALATAGPAALLGAGAAIVGAINVVLEAAIVGGQQVVDALLPLDLGNLLTAFVDATGDFFRSFGDAGQIIIDGIVFVQQTIATALAAEPPVAPLAPAAKLGPESVPSLNGGDDALLMSFSTGEGEDQDDESLAPTETTEPAEGTVIDEEVEDDEEGEDDEDAEDGEKGAEDPAADDEETNDDGDVENEGDGSVVEIDPAETGVENPDTEDADDEPADEADPGDAESADAT